MFFHILNVLAPSPSGSPRLGRMGGALFYITAVNKNTPAVEITAPSTTQQGLSVNDNWQLSSRKLGPHKEKLSASNSVPSTPEEEMPARRPELNDLSENTFKEELVTSNDRPTIVSFYGFIVRLLFFLLFVSRPGLAVGC